jgi:hypothetical protein
LGKTLCKPEHGSSLTKQIGHLRNFPIINKIFTVCKKFNGKVILAAKYKWHKSVKGYFYSEPFVIMETRHFNSDDV